MDEAHKELVKRLRALRIMDEVGSDNPLGREAADALEALAGEVARWKQAAANAVANEPATDAAPALYAGQDPKISLNTDAAPAVCEWRGSKDGQLAYMGCTKRLEWTYDRRKCPSCGKSITFTEAK